MLDRLADLVITRARRTLLTVLVIVLGVGTLSMGLSDRLTMGGYESPGTEAAEAQTVLEKEFKQGKPNLTLVVEAPDGVDTAASAAAGRRLTEQLAGEDTVTNVVSYWSLDKAAALRSKDSRQALVSGRITGDFDQVNDRVEKLREEYTGRVQGLDVALGGSALMNFESTERAAEDAAKAETLVFPLVLIVLVLIFGSLVAATVPLAVAFATMLTVFGLLFGLSFLFDANNLIVNICTFLGLGLAIDYSLLFITRYREHTDRGVPIPDAIRATMRTVGRTVIFSAVTLAIAFLSLVVMPFGMLRSIGVGGTATTLAAALATLVVVPAMLAWAGPRIDRLRLIRRKPRPAAGHGTGTGTDTGTGPWHRLALLVMRRPVPLMLGVLALMGVLAAPALNLNMQLPDEQALPKSTQSARVAQDVRAGFDSRESQALQVVARDIGSPARRGAEIGGYAADLSSLPGVARVDAMTGSYVQGKRAAPPNALSAQYASGQHSYLSVVPAVDGHSEAGAEVVERVRTAEAPFEVIVGGEPAVSVDTFDTLAEKLPLSLAILALGTYLLLFLLTGSVILPLVAMLLSVLSLSATFGALVFVFQDGNLKWLVGDFINTGSVTWSVPIMVGALGFGLSMDYAVFILSRIKEEYDRSGDSRMSVAIGLERVGKVITYAAVILSLVFIVMITSGISYMKALGLGMPLAILMDATLIRGILLPAFMRLLGRSCWWAPASLRRFHQRYGISEQDGGGSGQDGGRTAPSDATEPPPLTESGTMAGMQPDRERT